MTVPISSITPVTTPEPAGSSAHAGKPGEFAKVLEGTIHNLESLNQAASDSAQKFLTGQNEELHTTILATQRASLAFELGLQVRNKIVDAYQEVMRMQM